MVYENKIKGKYVYLTSADIQDAEFSLSLRQNPTITRYIPKLNITLEQQKAWIASQREKPGDYFFIAKTYEGIPIGTISVYNINGETAESGRLALIGDALQNTETSLLQFDFAFNILKLKQITGFILAENNRVARFNRQFGIETGEPIKNENGILIRETLLTYESFSIAEKRLKKILYENK